MTINTTTDPNTEHHYRTGGCDFCTRCLGCGVRMCFDIGTVGVSDAVRVPATGEMAQIAFCTTCGTEPEQPIRWENVAYAATFDPWAKESGPRPEVTTREQLLANAATKRIRSYTQYDAEHDPREENSDENGDGCWATVAVELRNTSYPVRVQVLEGTDKDTAVRLLRKVLQWVETDGLYDFNNPNPPF